MCLDSIFNNKSFNHDIEVVVSDNNSTDGTEELAKIFQLKYPNTFKYNKNEIDIGSCKNIILVLNIASGKYVKLHNDYSVFTEDGLDYLYQTVKSNSLNRDLIFWDNREFISLTYINNVSLNQLVEEEGWNMSWMGNYGYWKDDYVSLPNKELKLETLFVQVDYFLRIFENRGSCSIYRAHYTERFPFEQKQGGYNFFKIHTTCFFSLFRDYYEKGMLSRKSYEVLKRRTYYPLLSFVDKLLFDEKDSFNYSTQWWWWYFFKNFGMYSWFYVSFIRRLPHLLKKAIKH